VVSGAAAVPTLAQVADPPRRRPSRIIVHLVHNAFTNDTRVLSEARSAAALGDRVVVAAVEGRGAPGHETRDGVEILRVRYDPGDARLWRQRTHVSRPWRFRREAAGWFARHARAGRAGTAKAAIGAIGLIAVLPWTALTIAYHYGIRALDRPLAVLRVPPPSRIVGSWIEGRAKAIVFVGHRPLRLRDWGRRIRGAVERGDVPVADIWHAEDLETLPLALGLRRAFGGRVLFDSHELFLEAAGRARMNRVRRAILRAAERRWITAADAVETVNDAVAGELSRRHRIAPPLVVRNCRSLWIPPSDFVSPLRAAAAEAGLDAARPIVIVHGGFQVDRGFEETLDALRERPAVNVVFLGYGPLEASFRALAATAPWRGRLAILPAVDPDDVVPWLAGADLSSCLIQPTTLNHRLSTPNKLFEAVTAGVPIVASDLPAIAEIVRGYDVGRLVDPSDTVAIGRAFDAILALTPVERDALRGRARAAATTELNWEHEFARLAAVYDSLAPRPATSAHDLPAEAQP
jgi:glycosyltransferase involved in cell wall biosynthesis